MNIQQYINNISNLYESGKSTEHSYRGDLQQLLTSLLKDVSVTNEPKRIECGAPDYILTRKEIPIGYIEAKDIGVNLDDKSHEEQFNRYRAALNNLIITDYLGFHFYKDGSLTGSIFIGEVRNGKIYSLADNFDEFITRIQNFSQIITQSIKSPDQLAKMMASRARLMANVIFQALEEDDKNHSDSELQGQREAFRNILIHDIDNLQFSDIYAQTIAYGLFAARYHDSELSTFSREKAAYLIPLSNPFLRKLFQTVATYSLEDNSVGLRLLWVVEELVQVFLATDVVKIMKNFGRSTHQHDPVVHFYETFLAEYDPKLRKARGVWYTPEPVVNFIVRAVDEILKVKFDLPLGLADTAKTNIKIKTDKPDGRTVSGYVEMDKEVHRVQILDPATGTGTFLAKTIEHIYEKNFANQAGAWPAYVKQDLIPRLNGFELLMTSYAMAHLKIDMLLSETGYKTETSSNRLRIFLTNSLEEHHPDTGTLFASWLSSEANEANHIKRDNPVMVVMGNPPYSGHSSNKGEWIEKLLEPYKQEPIGGKLKERNPKWLNDDYVKFIRYGQHFIDKNGEGILAFITNHSYLDNPTFRGMRWSLMQSFDEIYILDLHGNSKKKEIAPDGTKDENVFDIQQGVAIALFIKTGRKSKHQPAQIIHHELFGKRSEKYEALNQLSVKDIKNKLLPSAPHFAWVNRNQDGFEAYNLGFSLQDLFPVNSVGIVTSRDNLVIDVDRKKLEKRMGDFFDLEPSISKEKYAINENKTWSIAAIRDKTTFDASVIQPISYRPFDNRWVYFDSLMIERSRGEVMNQMQHENYGLIFKRGGIEELAAPVFITNTIAEFRSWSRPGMQGGDFLSPLYVYHDSQDLLSEMTRKPNFSSMILDKFISALNLKFVTEKTDELGTFSPIDLLDYIYAVLNSRKYCEIYKEFLKSDFPRVPYPVNQDKFWALVNLGRQLRQLHLLDGGSINELITSYPQGGSNLVDALQYRDEKVYINASQYFDGVPILAWNFYIGGYQPAQKWLKDRKGHELSFGDILHYQKIIKVLVETDRLINEIDILGVS